jgi:phytoene dehydrogenase-like protein
MGIFFQYAPYTLHEGTWDEPREPFGDRVMSLIAEYAPNIRQIVEHRQVLTARPGAAISESRAATFFTAR